MHDDTASTYYEVHGDPVTKFYIYYIFLYTYRYSIMRRCWRADPAQRPTFSDLASILDRFLQLVADYTELTMTLPVSEADPEYEDVKITDNEGGRVTLYILFS